MADGKIARKLYIGDGVYAEYDGFAVTLSTERESGVHWLVLEPDHLDTLNQFIAAIRKATEGA